MVLSFQAFSRFFLAIKFCYSWAYALAKSRQHKREWEETCFSQCWGIQVGASGTDFAAKAGASLWIFEWNLAARRCREKLSVEDAEQLWIIHVTVSSLCFRCFRGNFIFHADVAPKSVCNRIQCGFRSPMIRSEGI